MNRREFSAQALSIGVAAAAGGLSPLAFAQQGTAPVEGKHYVKLNQPVPVAPGKIEVIEFFWYGCPHCNEFEPMLDAWSKQLPSDVAFRRVPVAFRPEPFVMHQKIFYALDEMGLIPSMHRKVFYAIHGRRMRLDKTQEIGDFMQSQGVDSVKFLERMESFSVQSKAKQAAKLAADYKIDGVPAIGIQGRFYTSGGLVGNLEGVVAVSNFLIDKVRNKG
jgi:protein dithiol oxidoreductase (disulfide-forming)